jgi:monothiol glutaredoxin
MTTEEKIKKQLADNAIILYMKGVPTNPECGFSAKTVGILNATHIPFAFVNVLAAPFIREKLPKISHWPTFPQLFVNGELVGGCDIVEAMSNDGSLLTLLESTKKTDGLSNNDIEQLVKQGIVDSQVFIEGAGCDFTVTVISEKFADLTAVKKQQMVMATLTEVLASGKLHAVSVQVYTPDEWQARSVNSAGGLLQIGL